MAVVVHYLPERAAMDDRVLLVDAALSVADPAIALALAGVHALGYLAVSALIATGALTALV